MTEKNPHLDELGQFLKARRSELSPTDIGLPPSEPGSRRVSGLRREEVAARAAISHDYYSRIEQGRLAPSEPVLDVIAGVLQLTADQRSYAEGLAARADRRTPAPRRRSPVRPQVQRLLDKLTDQPAFVVGKYLDILAWNRLTAAIMPGLDELPPEHRNYVRMMFTDPRMKDFYDDWTTMARIAVQLLRMQAVDNPSDPRLAAIVGELSVTSVQFRQWWAARNVFQHEFGNKTIRHPEVGELTFDWDAFATTGDPDQQLIVWSAEPGSPTEDKFRILSSWAAENTAANPR